MPVIDPRDEIARLTAELAEAKERERVLREAVEKFMVYFTSANGVPVERATVRANSAAVRAGRAALGEP